MTASQENGHRFGAGEHTKFIQRLKVVIAKLDSQFTH